jgi:hypothetical protein
LGRTRGFAECCVAVAVLTVAVAVDGWQWMGGSGNFDSGSGKLDSGWVAILIVDGWQWQGGSGNFGSGRVAVDGWQWQFWQGGRLVSGNVAVVIGSGIW